MRTARCCRKLMLALVLLLGVTPVCAFGADINFKSDTIFRFFERDTADKKDAAVLPGYEYLQLDAGQLNDYGLSFHLYGWGRADLADNNYFDDTTAGELLYAYVEYRREQNRCNFRLGRQYVFEGVANDAIDGLRVSGDLGDYFSVSLYGGQPVALDSTQGRSGDSIYGGRLAHHFGTLYQLGVSYKKIENDSATAEERLGIDLSASLPANLTLFGYSSYNQETESWAEHSYELRIPIDRLIVKPYYRHFSYEDYFNAGANAVNPFKLLARFDEELTAYGVDALWQLDDNWTVGGKVKWHEYDRTDSAQTYSVLVSWQGDTLTQYGAELGRTAAGDATGNDYTLVRLYGYCDEVGAAIGIDFFSADVLLAYYDEAIYGEDSSLFVSFGGGKRFMNDALSIKLSGDYSQDPYFDDDLRGMLTVSYAYAQ